MKRTILDTITDRLTTNPTSQRFVFNFFCQPTNFLIQFFANAQNTLSFFPIPTNPNAVRNERVFSPTLCLNLYLGKLSLREIIYQIRNRK